MRLYCPGAFTDIRMMTRDGSHWLDVCTLKDNRGVK